MLNGIINVYKEKGFTSFDVVAKMRGIVQQKKIGHTGTLDPDAEGVLPVCLGKATKTCDLLQDKRKEYEAVLLLGVKTDTQDITGQVLNRANVDVSNEEICAIIKSFEGNYQQIPPMYSALKINGQKLCDLARRGIEVERKARNVTIYSIDIMEIALPEIRIKVKCSKGTYIRTLCHDIGEEAGCYGCMKSLVRTCVDHFTIQNALKLSEIEDYMSEGRINDILIPVDSVFYDYPKVICKKEADKLLKNGNRIPLSLIKSKEDNKRGKKQYRLYSEDMEFIGIYQLLDLESEYKPIKIFME